MEDAGVFADPAEAGAGGEFTFDERTGIDEDARIEGKGEAFAQAREERIKQVAQHDVVIFAAGVLGDTAGLFIGSEMR